VRLLERWALVSARPLWLLALLMAPLRWVIEKIADLIIYLVARKIRPEEAAVGEDEFLTMVDQVLEDGEIDHDEHQLINRVFEFGDRRVTEVMTPAEEVFALSYNLPLSSILSEVRQNIYSRVPVYQGSRDRIVGLLYLKDLVPAVYKLDKRGAPFRKRGRRWLLDILHQGYFIPKATKCEQLLREFRRRRTHMGLVVDEYGHFIGLVTMEDLLEEMFGEIVDEKELPSPSSEFPILDAPLSEEPSMESAQK
jgi:CBS domain containing-hemolysin-like protein